MEDFLSSGDGFRPKRLSEEEIQKDGTEGDVPPPEPPVKRVLSHLGWGEELPTLAMFTCTVSFTILNGGNHTNPDDDGDWYPGTLNPEVYETRVPGPRLAYLNGVGFGLGWEMRGRLFHPRGVLPKSLFTAGKTDGRRSGVFYKEVFFTIRLAEEIGDNECSYLVKFTPSPLWPEDWERHRPEETGAPQGTPFLIDERLPPLCSHARGLGLTLSQLDKLDGLEKLKLKQLLEKLSEPRLPPVFSHAWGLGLTMDYLDRIDGLIPVRDDKEPGITLWRSAKFSEPADICPPMRVNSGLEGDCTHTAMKRIFEEAEVLQERMPSTPEKASVSEHEEEKPDIYKSTENLSTPKKISLKKRFMSFLKKHFCCLSNNNENN